jgi:Rrf2 family protein
MRADSHFATALHILTLLARADRVVSSSWVARSVNTNPVVIRQIIAHLRRAGLVRTVAGRTGGAALQREPGDITLDEVYALFRAGDFFGLHPSEPNPRCPVGRNIQAVLLDISVQMDGLVADALAHITLADVLAQVTCREAPPDGVALA